MNIRLLAVAAVLVAALTSVRPAAAQVAGGAGSCVDDIELTMRKLQARADVADTLFRQEPTPTNPSGRLYGPYRWPSRLDGTPTPLYPPDNWFDSDLQRSPAFGLTLITSVKCAFFGCPTFEDTASCDPLYLAYFPDTLNPEGLAYDGTSLVAAFTVSDFTYDLSGTSVLFRDVDPSVDPCLVYGRLKICIERLYRLGSKLDFSCARNPNQEEGFLRTAYSGAGSYALDTTPMADLWEMVTGFASDCWSTASSPSWCLGPQGWQPESSCGLMAYEECQFHTTVVGSETRHYLETKWIRRSSRYTTDLRGLKGRFDAYQVLEPLEDGAGVGDFDTPNNIAVDSAYHLLFAGPAGGIFTSNYFGKENNPPKSDEPPSPAPVGESGTRYVGWQEVTGLRIVYPEFNLQPSPASAGCSTCGHGSFPTAPSVEGSSFALAWDLGPTAEALPAGLVSVRPQSLSALALDRRDVAYGFGTLRTDVTRSDDSTSTTVATGRVSAVLSNPAVSGEPDATALRVEMYRGAATGTPYSVTEAVYREGLVNDPASPGQTIAGKRVNIDTTGECEAHTVYTESGHGSELSTGVDPVSGVPTRVERRVVTLNVAGDERTTVLTVLSGSGAVASRSVQVERRYPWGWSIVEARRGAVGSELVTSWSYDDRATVGGVANPAYSKVVHQVGETGTWVHREYGADGSVARTIAQFQNSAYGVAAVGPTTTQLDTIAASSAARTVSVGPVTVGSVVTAVRESVSYLLGQPVSRTYTVSWPAVSGAVEEWEVRCASAAAPASVGTFLQGLIGHTADNSQPNLVTVTVREPAAAGLMGDKTRRVLRPDGSITVWRDFTVNPATGLRTYEVDSGPANAAGTGLRAGFGARTAAIRRASGALVSSKTYDLSTGSPVLLTQSTNDLDDFDRITEATHADGTVTETVHGCCGVESETGPDGVVASYSLDRLRRVTAETRTTGSTSVTTTTTYDAEGRVLTESRQATGMASPQVVATSVYNLAGDLTSSADALGNTTTYARQITSTEVIDTQTMPDPDGAGGPLASPVSVQRSYLDGRPKSANIPYTAATSAGPPGATLEEVDTVGGVVYRTRMQFAGSAGTSSPQLTKSYIDALGHVRYVVAPPAAAGQPDAITTMIYTNDGRLKQTIDPDGISTLQFAGHGEDDLARLGLTPPPGVEDYFAGGWSLSVQDIDGDGQVAWAGPDRISLSRSSVVPTIDGPMRRSESFVWVTGDGTAAGDVLLVSQTDALTNGLGSYTSRFGEHSSTETTRPAAGVTVVTSGGAGGTAVTTSQYGRTVSTTRTRGGVFAGTTLNTYDALGRLTRVATVRTPGGSPATNDWTDFAYDALDRQTQVTGPADDRELRQITKTVYDNLGRAVVVKRGEGAMLETDLLSTTYAYSPSGQVTAVRGAATPVDNEYDELGRLLHLTTYRGLDGSGDVDPLTAAVTTWTFDPDRGFLTSKVYNDDTHVDYAYTAAGRLAVRTNARGITTAYTYGTLSVPTGGLPSLVDYSDATPDVKYAYDRLGRPKQIIDAAGKRTITYNEDGRPLQEVIGTTGIAGWPDILANTKTVSTYATKEGHPFGPRTSVVTWVKDTAVNTVTFGHDEADRIQWVEKSGARAAYAYDDITGAVTKVGSAMSTTMTDPLDGRLLGSYGRDPLGRAKLTTWTDTASTNLLARDNYGAYDGYGRLAERQYDLGNKGEVWSLGHDDLGQLSSIAATFPDTSDEVRGMQFAYEHDRMGNRVSVQQGDTVNGMYAAGYERNALNQYAQREVPGNVEVTGHAPVASAVDVNGQLAYFYALGGGFYHARVGIDNSGGPAKGTVTVQELPGDTFSYDVFLPGTPEVMSYDEDGNLTEDGLWHYEWDGENRLAAMTLREDAADVLLSAEEPWVRLEFAYDHMHRRIGKRLIRTYSDPVVFSTQPGKIDWAVSYDRRFLYQGPGEWALSAEIDCVEPPPATGFAFCDEHQLERTYAWGPDLSGTEGGAGTIGGLALVVDDWGDLDRGSSPVGPMAPAYDCNGNAIKYFKLTPPASGDLTKVAEFRYGPFGEDRGRQGFMASALSHRWSTKYQDDETGLSYYGYRYYSAGMGRWISRDPIGEAADVNHYAAVGNAPVSNVDILGLFLGTWHRDITRRGLAGTLLSEGCIEIVSLANVRQDDGVLWNGHPFSDPRNHGDDDQIGPTIDLMEARLRRVFAEACPTCPQVRKSLQEFGRVLHAAQDLYAHSDWVEFTAPLVGGSPADIPIWPFFHLRDFALIHTGTYIWPSDNAPGPRSHRLMNKDHPTSIRGSTQFGSSTYFDMARNVSIRHTRVLWDEEVLAKLTSDQLDQITGCCRRDLVPEEPYR